MFPFRSTILHEKSQLQELNSRLESYLAGVRELEKENEMLSVEIQHLRKAGGSEESHASADEIHKMRWELEELALEKARAEMQHHNLQQEIQELRNYYATEQMLHKNIRQEVKAHQKMLQQIEGTNASLEGIIFQLQAEYQTLESQHEQAKWEVGEEVRRARQVLVTQSYPTTRLDFENHSLAFSEIWQENFEVCRNKIEELEAAAQQEKERTEDLNRENVLLIEEIETLKKDLEDQFILQNQMEQDFLTFQQKHGMDVEEYQREIGVLEDEKQHLASAIALNLKEQQKLMQVKMGLNLELATYRALLEAEHRKQQEIGEQLWKSRKGADTRSHRYNVMPGLTLDTLDEKLWKPSRKAVPSTFWRDAVTSNKGITSTPIPYRTSTRTIKGSFSDKDLLYTEKSSLVQNVDSSTRSRNTYRGAAGSTSVPHDPFSTMKKPQVQHKVLPKEENESGVVLPGPENVVEVVTHTSRIHATESASDNETGISENKAEPQSSSDLPTPISEMEYHDGNFRTSQSAEEEEYKRQYLKDVRAFEPGAKQLEFKADLSEMGSLISPDSYISTANHEADAEITSRYFLSDNIIEKNEEEPTTELVQEMQVKSSPESSDNRGITLSEEGSLTDDVRIRDVIETVIKPTDLGKMVSPEAAITYHIEEKEVLEDGTTKREIVIQSRSEKTVDVTDQGALQEVLNMDTKSPEMQLKGALEHLTGSETGSFIDGLLHLDIKGSETPGKVSVNVEVKEQLSKADDLPAPTVAAPLDAGAGEGAAPLDAGAGEGAAPLDAGAGEGAAPLDAGAGEGAAPLDAGAGEGAAPLDAGAGEGAAPLDAGAGEDAAPLDVGAGESDLEGTNGKHEEVLNVTMSAADFRRTMLSSSEPESQKFQERPTSFSMDETVEEVEKGEAELYGTNEQQERPQNLYGDEGTENIEQTKFTLHDSFAKELRSPCIIEESIKVPQGVQASIVKLLKEETEDPELKLKGALEQLKGAVPENLREELSLLTGEIQERSDNVSVNIKNIQQSSQRGVVTIEAEVNVSQSLDPEDFFSMEKYTEDEQDVGEIGSGLTFLNSQQEIQRLLNGKDLQMVESLNDDGRIKANTQVFKEQNIFFEPSAGDVEDAEEYSFIQGHTGYQTGSSEMEGDVSHWLQKDISKMYGEEFIHKVSDPVDSSGTLNMNVNRIMSMHASGGDSEGSMSFITQEEIAEGTDGKGLDDNVYCYEEWESGSRGELAVTDAIEEGEQQASDSELMQYSTSPKVLTNRRVVVSESITQVVHGEQDNGVTYLDEDQLVIFSQSDDEP
ncbi:synemin [Pristis pectinata]|uniref:synemin n=1 Tax=Pristis pectinata TaxID=685728 RepID=UPI00223CCF4F|nr:synemin [Pristis pectinata]XP_051898658.1 synemin [Pristis pectinata]